MQIALKLDSFISLGDFKALLTVVFMIFLSVSINSLLLVITWA